MLVLLLMPTIEFGIQAQSLKLASKIVRKELGSALEDSASMVRK